MPRIRQKAQDYAEADFLKEIQHCMVDAGVGSYRELAEQIGICPASMCKRKKNVGGFSVEELRGLVRVLRLNPAVMLKLLGYQGKDIPKEFAG